MHAETLALLTQTIVFSKHEVSKVIVMEHDNFLRIFH